MNERIIRDLFYVGSGRFLSAGLQSLFYIIFAYVLEPDLYGQMSYLIAIAGTASILSRFGLSYSVIVASAKKKFSLVNQINFLLIILTSIASIVLLFVEPILAILTLGISLFAQNQANLLGLKNYKSFFRNALIKGCFIIVFPFSLYFVLGIPGIVLGMAFSNLICSFDFLKLLKKKLNSFSEVKTHLPVLIHNFGTDSASTLPRMIDKLLIVPLFGFLSVGIYQFNLQILFAFEILPIALHSYLLSEESSGHSHKKINYYLIIISVILVVLIIISAPFIINQIFPKYSDGIFSLQILIISLIPLSISAIFNAKLQALESKKIGYSAIIRIASLLALIVILGDQFGLVGLSLAVLISTTLYSIFLVLLFKTTKL